MGDLAELGPLLALALVLTAGLVGGEVFSWLRMPRVTGWIVTGVLLRALDLSALSPERVAGFAPFSQFVLAYIAFSVGSQLRIRSLLNAQKRLFWLVIAEAIITPTVVLLVMSWLGGLGSDEGMLLAAVAIAGAPGTTMIVVRELRARGVFVKTLMAAVALIDLVAVLTFVFVSTELQSAHHFTLSLVRETLPAIAKTLWLGVGVGVGAAGLVALLTRAIVGQRQLGASLVAAILLAWGVAEWAGVSSIMAVTFLGIVLVNTIADKERAGEAYLSGFGNVLFTIFYTLAGMRLQLSAVVPVAGLVLLFFLARLSGKWLASYVAMHLAGAPRTIRAWLGPALIPHGGVAVGIIILIESSDFLQPYAPMVTSVGLSALAINQFVGPSITGWALGRAGEVGADRPRLLNFLREEDILVGFRAPSFESAIGRLVDRLMRTHEIEGDREELVQQILERNRRDSSYLGEGLMVPYARVKTSEEVSGVMAISQEGMRWPELGGNRVHCVVLLATPHDERDRHLEVVSAFDQAITFDRTIQEQLYHADTAAHAYRVLHAGDAADFNYFLEDILDDESVVSEAAS